MRFRSLITRIVFFFSALLILVQGMVFLMVNTASEQILAQELELGDRILRRALEQNRMQLAQSASVLAADFGFREAVATDDADTVLSALRNHGSRLNASTMTLIALDGRVIADTLYPDKNVRPFPFGPLLDDARQSGQSSGVVVINRRPYQLVVVPVLAPVPIAWVAIGFVMDDMLARDLKELTSFEISIWTRGEQRGWMLNASSSHESERASLPQLVSSPEQDWRVLSEVEGPVLNKVEGRIFARKPRLLKIPLREDWQTMAVLHDGQHARPFAGLHLTLLGFAGISVVLCIAGSVVLARGMLQPVTRLTHIARGIRDGDYSQPAGIASHDEIGELARTFDHMREAIAARQGEILRLAYEDTLTMLPNRAMFNDRLQQAINLAQRTGTPLSVLMLDLDRFKYVNDTLGHHVGDLVLREVAARLKALQRKSDTICRLGGDEFAIILPVAEPEHAIRTAGKILSVLEEPIMLKGQPVDVGGSIGIASFPQHSDDPYTLLRYADTAMYAAKSGNTGFAVYDARFHSHPRDYLSLLGELRRAVEENELLLHYQPKVDLKTGRAAHVEALVRWRHPERGLIMPAEFIPFAEQTGYIKSITRWVIQAALAQCRAWHSKGMDIAVSINIAARDLLSTEFADYLRAQIKEQRVAPEWIYLEITESGFISHAQPAIDVLLPLKKLGVRVCIDDFGTGYSSLAYIRKLPVDELKIDQSFISNMARDKADATIVRSTIELGHNMDIKVVAEGVADEATWAALKLMGCDYVQGYYFSEPLSADGFEQWTKAREPRRFIPHVA